LVRTRSIESGVDGQLLSAPGAFSVQIYRKIIVTRNNQPISTFTLRFYNNRINDWRFNSTIYKWFDGTSDLPVILTENRLWNASVSFEPGRQIKREYTRATFKLMLNSPVPEKGFIRVAFPDSFEVSEGITSSVEIWGKSMSRQVLGFLDASEKQNNWSEPIKDGIYDIDSCPTEVKACPGKYRIFDGALYRLFQESNSMSFCHYGPLIDNEYTEKTFQMSNVTTLLSMSLPANSELLLIIDKIRTPERSQTKEIFVVTGSDNITGIIHDSGAIPSVQLGENALRNASIVLSTWVAGSDDVSATFQFRTVNRLSRTSLIVVRLPLTDFLIENGTNLVLYPELSTSGVKMDTPNFGNDYVNVTLKFHSDGTDVICATEPWFCPDGLLALKIGGFTNRRFTGPSSRNIEIITRGTKEDSLEVLDRTDLTFKDSQTQEKELIPSILKIESVMFPERVSSVGKVNVTFSVSNSVPSESEIVMRFSASFQVSGDSRLFLNGVNESIRNITLKQGEATTSSHATRHFKDSLALPANNDGILEITIYRQAGRHPILAKGDKQTIVLTNIRAPNFVMTTVVEITTFRYEKFGRGMAERVKCAIDSVAVAANVLLPALLLPATIGGEGGGISLVLSSSTAGKKVSLAVQMTTINKLDTKGKIFIKFPDDFDISGAYAGPDEVPTTQERADCNEQLQCQSNNTITWNVTSRLWTVRSFTLDNKTSINYTYDGIGFDGDFNTTVLISSDCSVSSFAACRKRVLSLVRTDRSVGSLNTQARYTLVECSSPRLGECAKKCNAALNINANCTKLVSDTVWNKTTIPGSQIPAGQLLKIYIKGIRTPRYSGSIGRFSLYTALPTGVAVDGNDDIGVPAMLPELLSTPRLRLEDSRAFTDTQVFVSFSLTENPLDAGARIKVTFPPGFLYLDSEKRSQSVNLTANNQKWKEDLVFTYLDDILSLTRPMNGSNSGTAVTSVSMVLKIKNRRGGSGDSGQWKVETLFEPYPGDWRTVEEFVFDSVPITTANFQNASVSVFSRDGDRALNPQPIADQPLYVRFDLVLNQEIAYPDGKLIVTLGDGIILPKPPREVLVKFDCGSSQITPKITCKSAQTQDTCSWFETATLLSDDGKELTLVRQQVIEDKFHPNVSFFSNIKSHFK